MQASVVRAALFGLGKPETCVKPPVLLALHYVAHASAVSMFHLNRNRVTLCIHLRNAVTSMSVTPLHRLEWHSIVGYTGIRLVGLTSLPAAVARHDTFEGIRSKLSAESPTMSYDGNKLTGCDSYWRTTTVA